uniref:Uncharacterized protein n=1 Tax=Electrophorus electricus TaxID=8005 RepID=A0A4W4HP29_ELEEL
MQFLFIVFTNFRFVSLKGWTEEEREGEIDQKSVSLPLTLFHSPLLSKYLVMVLALGRKKQRLFIAISILPNLFLAFLLSSDPLLTLASPHHCSLPGLTPTPEVLNATLPWEKGSREGENGALSQCTQYMLVNGTQSGVEDCQDGWDYNVTEGLRSNIVTEVGLFWQHAYLVHVPSRRFHCRLLFRPNMLPVM